MAISSKTILNTIEWAKKLNFNRLSVIGNSLEPALTSANLVMQTMLGPPFDWWWNNKEVVFNTSGTAATGSITNYSITANELTLTVANSFSPGQIFDLNVFVTSTFLNGNAIVLDTANPTTVTAYFPHANVGSTAETGTMTNATVQDYIIPLPNFGHIEWAAVQDLTENKWYQLEVKPLSLSNDVGRPRFIYPNSQDAPGNVQMRLQPAPNKPFPVAINYQEIPVPVTSINQTWAPIPDFMGYIYNWGFLAMMYMFADDPRFAMANQKFVTHLLGAAQGLTEQEKTIFLNNYTDMTRLQEANNNLGIQARGNS